MEKRGFRKNPRNYDSIRTTSYQAGELAAHLLAKLGDRYNERPDQLLAAWPTIVGAALAPMTQAVAYEDGVLEVKVKNSTLHSLLSQYEKPKILKVLRERFPKIKIDNIRFRIG